MQYPLISEYREAIMSAEDNFDQLSSLRPVLDSYGNPVMSSGNFAVVFKMKDIDTGKFYAVKCFIKDQDGRNESYAMIADELKNVNSPYILPIRFLEKELFVDTSQSDETEFPVLVMDWVEGKTLDAYLRENLDNKYRLQVLSYRFCQMSAWLMSQPFAHGDLKPDNILVRENGSLVLVDYDGFYVPAMKGQEARELGSPDFRHPLRTANDFDEHIDDFSIATIALSLKAISIDAQLYHNYAASDRLLLSANDYHDIGSSKTMQKISQLASDSELATIIGAFYIAISNKIQYKMSFTDYIYPWYLEKILNFPKEIADLISEVVVVKNSEYTNTTKSLYSGTILFNIDGSYATYELDRNVLAKEGDEIDPNTLKLTYIRHKGTGEILKVLEGKIIEIDEDIIEIKGNGNKITRADVINLQLKYGDLKRVKIAEGIKEVEEEAFSEINTLEEITIPKSVEHLGNYAFRNCKHLETINYNAINCSTGYEYIKNHSEYDMPEEFWYPPFQGCENVKHINIGRRVEWLPDYIFENLINIKSIQIPLSVKYISICAFEGCRGLTEVIIPNSVIRIGWCAFRNCSGLSKVEMSDSVTEIDWCAFYGCKKLTKVKIPSSITKIGTNAFGSYDNLTEIIVSESNKKYDSRNNCNAIIETASNTLIIGCKNTIIPNSVTTIGKWAFLECTSLTSITIPNSVTKIGVKAFEGCTGLKELKIEDSIEPLSFGCSSNYYYEVFNYCPIKKLYIGRNLNYNTGVEFGFSPFYEILTLETILIGNFVNEIGHMMFRGCSSLTRVLVPNSVTKIGEHAFYDCNSLVEISIDDSVTEIGYEAFGNTGWYNNQEDGILYLDNYCIGYKGDMPVGLLSLRKGIRLISNYAFSNCSSITKIEIPNSTICIGVGVFRGCTSLTSITIPNSVNKIGSDVFLFCSNLTSIVVANGNRVYSSCNNCNAIIETASNTLIVGCKNTIIPSSVVKIGESSFCGCSNLIEISIPDSVQTIESGAFYQCQGLVSLRLSNYVTEIGESAFENCLRLEKIIIPKGTRQKFEKLLDADLHSKFVER